MIGTRHEKVTLVVLAYVIGFTTAFIAFGMRPMMHKSYMHESSVNNSQVQAADFKKVHHNITDIGTDENGLYVTVGGFNRIISSYSTSLSASAIEATSAAGFAYDHLGNKVSPDGWFAFFCEQTFETDEVCTPYVYSLFDDVIYKVTIDGVAANVPIQTEDPTWSEDSILSFYGAISTNADKPWDIVSYADDTSDVTLDAPEETQIQAVDEIDGQQAEESAQTNTVDATNETPQLQ